MNVGDLIFDSHYGLHGIVLQVPTCENDTSFVSVFYEDGEIDDMIHPGDDAGFEVLSER